MGNFDVSKPRIRLGCLGGGANSAAGRAHLSAIRLDGLFDLVGACFSRDLEINSRSAELCGFPNLKLYNSFEDVLSGLVDDIDALLVLTPTDQHFEHVTAALNSGISVICEKSLAVSSKEATEIEHCCSSQDRYLAVTYNYTGYPMVRELKGMIDAGDFGLLHSIRVEMPSQGFARANKDGVMVMPQEWRQRDYQVPTVSLDLGVHLHSLVYFLTGRSAEGVFCRESTNGNVPEVVDGVVAIAQYEGNLDVHYWYGKSYLGSDNGMKLEIYGSEKSAVWRQEVPDTIELVDGVGDRQIVHRSSSGLRVANRDRYERFKAGHPTGFIEAFANYYADVAEEIGVRSSEEIGKSGYVMGAAVSIDGLRFFEAAHASAKGGTWVRLGR